MGFWTKSAHKFGQGPDTGHWTLWHQSACHVTVWTSFGVRICSGSASNLWERQSKNGILSPFKTPQGGRAESRDPQKYLQRTVTTYLLGNTPCGLVIRSCSSVTTPQLWAKNTWDLEKNQAGLRKIRAFFGWFFLSPVWFFSKSKPKLPGNVQNMTMKFGISVKSYKKLVLGVFWPKIFPTSDRARTLGHCLLVQTSVTIPCHCEHNVHMTRLFHFVCLHFRIWSKKVRHREFPGGPPSKYYPGPTMLNFSDLTRTGAFIVVWSHLVKGNSE